MVRSFLLRFWFGSAEPKIRQFGRSLNSEDFFSLQSILRYIFLKWSVFEDATRAANEVVFFLVRVAWSSGDKEHLVITSIA